MPALAAVVFGLAWWLGLYLIARDPSKPVLRRAGYGLLSYALAVACLPLAAAAPGLAPALDAVRSGLACVPAVAWTGVLLRLAAAGGHPVQAADRWWRRAVAPLTAVAIAGLVVTGGFGGSPAFAALVAVVVIVPLLGSAWPLARHGGLRPDPARGLLLVATLLVALGVSALALGLGWLPEWLALAGIGADLAVLGVTVAVVDAFSEGESLRPDMRRSAVTAAAVAVQVLANPLHRLLDRISFPDARGMRAERAELRNVAEALPRRAAGHPLADLEDAEFVRLIRRALSHYGDLGRLVSSPLTTLPLVEHRLAARGRAAPVADPQPSPLDRAIELKAVLQESVTRLKPPGGEFGTSDEWRHYNALYFPYVVGLRPYSQRARHAGLSATARTALRWFQTQVPERTLHNWQNAAARLVAEDLRTRGFVVPVDQV